MTAKHVRFIMRRYAAGDTLRAIANALDTYSSAVYYRLQKAGVEIRPKSVAMRRHGINHAAFDVRSDLTAYWVGFLMADGCIWRNTVTVEISVRDAAHLSAFREFIEATYPVQKIDPAKYHKCPGATPGVRMKITSAEIVAALSRYGVLPHKSKTARVVDLEDNRHFWRGVLDGDGHIGIKRHRNGHGTGYSQRPRLHLTTGSPALLAQFKAYAERACPGATVSLGTNGHCGRASAYGRSARRILHELYGGAVVALARKAALAAAIAEAAPDSLPVNHVRA